MARARKPQTMAQFLVATVGFRKAATVLAFVAAWGIFTEKHGRPPTGIMEYAAWWEQSPAKAYREADLFKLAFRGERDPTAIWARVRELVEAKDGRDVVALHLGSVPV